MNGRGWVTVAAVTRTLAWAGCSTAARETKTVSDNWYVQMRVRQNKTSFSLICMLVTPIAYLPFYVGVEGSKEMNNEGVKSNTT